REEVLLYRGVVVGQDRARAVDVVVGGVAAGHGRAAVGRALEEALLHLRVVLGEHGPVAGDVAGQDVDAGAVGGDDHYAGHFDPVELEQELVGADRAVEGPDGRPRRGVVVAATEAVVGDVHAADGQVAPPDAQRG